MAKRVRVTMMLSVADPYGDGADLQDDLVQVLTQAAVGVRRAVEVASCQVSVWEIATEGEADAVRH